jgi:hypothetical protein
MLQKFIYAGFSASVTLIYNSESKYEKKVEQNVKTRAYVLDTLCIDKFQSNNNHHQDNTISV